MDTWLLASAIAQAVATVALVVITWRYTSLTRRLIDLQVEPRLDLEIPESLLTDPNATARLVNNAQCGVDRITLQVSALYRDRDTGDVVPVSRCLDNLQLDVHIRPNRSVSIDLARYFNAATEAAARHGMPPSVEVLGGHLVFSLEYRRVVDGRRFCYREPYGVVVDDDGTVRVSRIAGRQKMDSLDQHILRVKKGAGNEA